MHPAQPHQLPHHRPERPSPLPPGAPVGVLVARVAAAAQVIAGATVTGWFAHCAASVRVTDNAEDYSELGQLIFAAGSALAGLLTLLIAVPALLLRRGRSGARVTLIVMELVCVAPLLFALSALDAAGQAPFAAGVVVFALGGVLALAALARADVRAWSEA